MKIIYDFKDIYLSNKFKNIKTTELLFFTIYFNTDIKIELVMEKSKMRINPNVSCCKVQPLI